MQEQPHCQGPEEKLGTVGRRRGRAEGEREERGELLSRSGAGRGENYREENKPKGLQRRKSGTKRARRGGDGARALAPEPLLCFPQT